MNGARQRRRCLGASIALLSSAALAAAGPPLQTDDPDTPGVGNWEINIATELERRGQTWAWTPLLDVNYGLGDRLQLKVKPRAAILDEPGRRARSGAGNVQFGVKWRFLDEAAHGFAASFYPQVDVNPPARSDVRGLVDEGSDLVLPLQLGRTFGRAKLYAELGWVLREFRDDGCFGGIAFEYPADAHFRWTGELRFGADGDFREAEWLWNLGFKARLSSNAALLASAGHTLRESPGGRGGLFSYLGLQFTF